MVNYVGSAWELTCHWYTVHYSQLSITTAKITKGKSDPFKTIPKFVLYISLTYDSPLDQVASEMCQLMLLMVLIVFSFSSCMLLGLFWYIHSLWKTHKTKQEMLDTGITSHSSSISTVNLAVWHCAFMLTPQKLPIQDIQVCYMWKAHISFITYVHPPHVLAWLSPARLSWNLIFMTFMEICQENSKLVKIGQNCWALHIHT
jgi:hypothetical protein